MKNIIPLILIAAAVWIFWGYTSVIYKEAGGLREVRTDYENKLAQANEFQRKYEGLVSAYQSFSEADLTHLSRLAPDKMDAIRLAIGVSEIAARQGLLIEDIKISEPAKETKEAVTESGLGNTDLSFSVTSGYERFVAFLQDLEKSLRILDVTNIEFATAKDFAGSSSYNFNLGLRAYWLK